MPSLYQKIYLIDLSEKKRGKNIYKINLISNLPQTELSTEFKSGNSPYAFWTKKHFMLYIPAVCGLFFTQLKEILQEQYLQKIIIRYYMHILTRMGG